MKINVVIMAVLTVCLLGLTWHLKGTRGAAEGLKGGAAMLWRIWPLLLLALAVAGLLQVLLPQQVISEYLGARSPYLGILIAWLMGMLLPGAPYVTMPLAAALLAQGCGVGAAVTLVMSASLLGLTRIPYEIPFAGWQFPVVRYAGCALLPPIGGLIIHWFNMLTRLYPAN